MVNILLATITNILILFETFHGKGTSEENVVFGPAQLVVEDVPLPIAVPLVSSRSIVAILPVLSCRRMVMK